VPTTELMENDVDFEFFVLYCTVLYCAIYSAVCMSLLKQIRRTKQKT
jgi:hypothetical protein